MPPLIDILRPESSGQNDSAESGTESFYPNDIDEIDTDMIDCKSKKRDPKNLPPKKILDFSEADDLLDQSNEGQSRFFKDAKDQASMHNQINIILDHSQVEELE